MNSWMSDVPEVDSNGNNHSSNNDTTSSSEAIAFRINGDMKNHLDSVVEQTNMSQSEYLRSLVYFHLIDDGKPLDDSKIHELDDAMKAIIEVEGELLEIKDTIRKVIND